MEALRGLLEEEEAPRRREKRRAESSERRRRRRGDRSRGKESESSSGDERSRPRREARRDERRSEREEPQFAHLEEELAELRAELQTTEQRLSQLIEEVEAEEADLAVTSPAASGMAMEPSHASSAGGSDWMEAPPPPTGGTAVGAWGIADGKPIANFHAILVKHVEVKEPVSGRDGSSIVRTPKEALVRAKKIRDKICAPSDFNVKLAAKPKEIKRRFVDAAKCQSDHNTAREGGDLGLVTKGSLPPALEIVALALKENQVSQEICTEDGCYLLLRAS
ncbi:MAG: hypothetical protein SGPRY_001576 [Prymnesium sp.]